MIEFTFCDVNGNVLFVVQKQPTDQCGGGCCFDSAVADFRKTTPGYGYVPGQNGITITIRGV